MSNTVTARDLTVFIISDSIGKTAETVTNAVVSQFDTNGNNIKIKKFSHITDEDNLLKIINKIKKSDNAILVYTIVLPKLRELLENEISEVDQIKTIDIMGPSLSKFSQVLNQSPQLEPGLNHKVDQDYFDWISCIDFTVRCDDGKDFTKLKEADIVLIGVSRTSKTPLSTYLAHQGCKVANVPLVPEVTPPQELFDLPSRKVVGLTIDIDALQEIRKERLKAMNFNQQAHYAKVDRILNELDYAEKIMKRIGCMVINVTNQSIEETASEILSVKGEC